MHARWHTQNRSPSAPAAPPSRPLLHHIPAPGVRPPVFKITPSMNRTAPPAPPSLPSLPMVVSVYHKPSTPCPPTVVPIFNPSSLQHRACPHGSPWMTSGKLPITLPIGPSKTQGPSGPSSTALANRPPVSTIPRAWRQVPTSGLGYPNVRGPSYDPTDSQC